MTRVDEIVAALKSGPTPMFIYGIVALAKDDYEGVMFDLAMADNKVYEEQIKGGKKRGRRERF
jgi:hypothetical protein